MNYFEVFGLPKFLNIDLPALERKFHELSRRHHPDYFAAAPVEERQEALRMTALLNDAYRTLRHPIPRVEYLLTLEGLKSDGSKVSKSFLMEMFDLNEQLEEVQSGNATKDQISAMRRQIEQKAEGFESQIAEESREWDRLLAAGAPDTDLKQQLWKLTEILSESSYIRNLERDLEETP